MADFERDRELPFKTADSGESSRIAAAVAEQRRLRTKPTLPQQAQVKTGGLKQLRTGAAAFANTVETRLAAHPAFMLDAERGTTSIARLRLFVVGQSLLLILLATMLAVSLNQKNDNGVYAAMDAKSGARYLTPLATPTYTQAAVLAWAGARATSILNFGFHNVNERLQRNRDQFTDRGWQAFASAVDKSRLMQKIVDKEQVVTAAPIGAPVIVNIQDRPDGNRVWLIQVPISITVLSGKQVAANSRVLTIEVVTVPPTHNLAGLGINNWIES